MKHEIYKIAGVFKKHRKVFNFRYAYISKLLSRQAKGIVCKQAQCYYEEMSKGKHPILDFSSIWNAQSFSIDMQGFLILRLQEENPAASLLIPFHVSKTQLQRLQMGKYKEVIIKQRDEHWFAFLSMDISECEKKGDILEGLT